MKARTADDGSAGPATSEPAPGVRIPGAPTKAGAPDRFKPKRASVSLDYWSTGRTISSEPDPVSDEQREQDNAKWAPPTPSPFASKGSKRPTREATSGDPWEDILVRPGAGNRRPI
jgi:hypothetical protein